MDTQRLWYNEMLEKAITIIEEGYTFQLINISEKLGNNKIFFHFYNNQPIGDIKRLLKNNKLIQHDFMLHELMDEKQFFIGKYFIVSTNGYKEFRDKPFIKEILKNWNECYENPEVIRLFAESKLKEGEIISYLDNPYEKYFLENIDFSKGLEYLKQGFKITRKTWNNDEKEISFINNELLCDNTTWVPLNTDILANDWVVKKC